MCTLSKKNLPLTRSFRGIESILRCFLFIPLRLAAASPSGCWHNIYLGYEIISVDDDGKLG
jgi:hypothetical protein